MDQEKEEQRRYPEAYYPISKGVIKEEETSGENNVEHQMMSPLAYPPLPRGLIKEEELFGDAQEECKGQAEQLMASLPTSNGTINEEFEWSKEEHNAFNLDEGQQVSLEPFIAYLPLPRGAIKEEPLEEKEGDEQPQQMIIAYPPIARGRIKEELPSDVNQDDFNVEERELNLEPPLAYPPLPKGMIKEEPFEERGEEQAKQVIAYLSIPKGMIKEESVDNRDDFNLGEHKLIPQEGGNQNLVEESTPSPIISATADMSTADLGNGTKRRKSKNEIKKKITMASTAVILPSTESGDQSARAMSTIGSRTRQLKQGSTSMVSTNDDGEKGDHSTAGSHGFGGHEFDKTVSTNSSRTRSHHSKPGSASVARVDNGETSKKSKLNKDKGGIKEKQQQGTKDDKRNETSENSSLRSIDGDSSSSSVETSERPSDSHNKFSCKECGRGFQRKCSLRLHLLNAHNGTGHATGPLNAFKCDKCMKTYKSKNSLVRHLMNECRVEPAFPCPQCDYKATHKSNLRRHLISTHKVDSSQLDNVSADAALYVRPVLPFTCEKCEGTFKSKDSLYNHKKYVCGVAKSFSCLKCDYRTARRYDLRKHLLDVHEVEQSQLANYGAGKVVRPQLPFKCDKCERSYKQKHYLKGHKDFECGKIPSFPCNQCGYRASRNTHLKRHIDAVHGSSSLQA